MATVLMAAYTNYRRDPRVKREAEALVEAGYRVVFIARRQKGEPHRETIADVDVVKLPGLREKCTSVGQYLLDYAAFFCMLLAHLTAHPLRYRLIHINNMPDFLVFAAVLPRLCGRPVIHDVHDLMQELYTEKFATGSDHALVRALQLQERWAGKFASAVLTVEDRLRDILSTRGIPRERIHVLMNLPDERIFAPRTARPPKAASEPPILVYHGTLAHRLGLDIAIRAVAKARERLPSITLRIIGAGEERGRLLALRDELGLADNVTFSEGFVPVERIPSMLEDCDIGVIPLRISSGTDIMLPTKLLEYVSLGIPCIVPRTTTIARYFDDDMVQFFEPEDVDSLTRAIVALAGNLARQAQMSEESARRFRDKYRWSEHKKTYTELVERLLDNARADTRTASAVPQRR